MMEAAAFLLLLSGAAPSSSGTLHVKASAVVAPCVEATRAAYRSATGREFVLEVGSLVRTNAAAGADVVVGAEPELTRVVETGVGHPDLDVAIAKIPWVLVGAQGDLRALDRPGARVRLPSGALGLEARRGLEQGHPDRVISLSTSTSPASAPQTDGELAVMPLSLAGTEDVTPLSLRPLEVRAIAVRTSRRQENAREFIDFLTRGAGNAAFCACGRGVAE